MTPRDTTVAKPVIFSAFEVGAFMRGEKSQARMMVELTNLEKIEKPTHIIHARRRGFIRWNAPHKVSPEETVRLTEFTKENYDVGPTAPFGEPGERLFVQETWRMHIFGYEPSSNDKVWCAPMYRADFSIGHVSLRPASEVTILSYRWQPAGKMPFWASRFLLQLTDVYAQRLQEVTTEEIAREGFICPESIEMEYRYGIITKEQCDEAARWLFYDEWDARHRIRGSQFSDNPWIYAATFREAE